MSAQTATLSQFAGTRIQGDFVLVPSSRNPRILYRVSATGCNCAGFVKHKHCYHQSIRTMRLWLEERLQFENLTFEVAIENLRKAKLRGGCGRVNCSFCFRLHSAGCPRTADRQTADATFHYLNSQAA